MSGCDDFEMAIDLRLHGALEAAAAKRLDAHLATCAGCRRYERIATIVQTQLREARGASVAGMGRGAVGFRTRMLAHQSPDEIALVAVGVMVLLPLLGIHGPLAVVLVVVPAIALQMLLARRRLRGLGEADAPGDLAAFYARELERRIRERRRGRFVTPAVVVLFWVAMHRWFPLSTLSEFLFAGILAIALVRAARLERRAIERLESELADLRREGVEP